MDNGITTGTGTACAYKIRSGLTLFGVRSSVSGLNNDVTAARFRDIDWTHLEEVSSGETSSKCVQSIWLSCLNPPIRGAGAHFTEVQVWALLADADAVTEEVFEVEEVVGVFGRLDQRWFLVKYAG